MSTYFTRRHFLDLAAAAGMFGAVGATGLGASGCAPSGEDDPDNAADEITSGRYPVAFSTFADPTDQAARMDAVRRAVDLISRLPDGSPDPDWWMNQIEGQTVLIKPAHNSPNPYPFTASPESCAALIAMCLERGARRVIIADCMGIEHTIAPGAFANESPFGRGSRAFDPSTDATCRAFEHSGLLPGVRSLLGNDERFRDVGVRVGLEGAGDNDRVVFTSFREHDWRRYEFSGEWGRRSRMRAGWVRRELWEGTNWQGDREPRLYFTRAFDLEGPWDGIFPAENPGMWFPAIFDQVDHVINLTRVATHIWSHWTGAMKNWIGCQRPDDRIWMHQLNYLRNRRPARSANDPIRNECPYHEMLCELHVPSLDKERMCVGDGTEVVVSGGPDATDKQTWHARTVLAARDMVSADLASLALIKLAVRQTALACTPQPSSNVELLSEFIRLHLPWHQGPGHMRGTDVKLCNPQFSNWDWLAVRRARELGLGPNGPLDLRVRYDEGVARAQRAFLNGELRRQPTIPLEGTNVLPPPAPPTADEQPLASDASG